MTEIHNINCIDFIKNMEDESVDLLCTDPPYRITAGGGGCHGILGRENFNGGKVFKHNNTPFSAWLCEAFRILKNGGHAYIFTNDKNIKDLLNEAEKVGFKLLNILIWEKNNKTPSQYFMKQYEFICLFRKGFAKWINNQSTSNILKVNNIPPKEKTHPTEKPTELLKILIENSTKTGETVLDPFLGTGSCALACKELNRNFIGCELDENFYNIAKEKLKGEIKNV